MNNTTDNDFYFAFLGDTHITKEDTHSHNKKSMAVKEAINNATVNGKPKYSWVAIAGDLTHENRQYEDDNYEKIWGQSGTGVYVADCVGNHDYDERTLRWDEGKSVERFKKRNKEKSIHPNPNLVLTFDDSYYNYRIKKTINPIIQEGDSVSQIVVNCHFIVLNRFGGDGNSMKFLERELDSINDYDPIFICQHYDFDFGLRETRWWTFEQCKALMNTLFTRNCSGNALKTS